MGLCGHVTEMSLVSFGRTRARDPFDVEAPAVVVRDVDDVEVGADRARRFEIRRVVGAHDDDVVAGIEQRRGGGEQRGRGARCDDHVVGAQPSAPAAATPSRSTGIAEMIAVAEQQLVDVDVDAEVGEPAVGNRALRQVVGDRVVAEFFGRLDLDGHPAIAHRGSLADASATGSRRPGTSLPRW